MDKAIEDLKALMDDGPDWAKERAGIVLDLHSQHEAGDISDDEFAEEVLFRIHSYANEYLYNLLDEDVQELRASEQP